MQRFSSSPTLDTCRFSLTLLSLLPQGTSSSDLSGGTVLNNRVAATFWPWFGTTLLSLWLFLIGCQQNQHKAKVLSVNYCITGLVDQLAREPHIIGQCCLLLVQLGARQEATADYSKYSVADVRIARCSSAPYDETNTVSPSTRCILKNFRRINVALGNVRRDLTPSEDSYSVTIDDI